MATVFDALCTCLAARVKELTFLVALGTHPPMSEAELNGYFGHTWKDRPKVRIVQHEWRNPGALVRVGTVDAVDLEELSSGLLAEEVTISINRPALAVDRILIVNPVFPHEVVGFSGGHKYFFPGISGSEILDASHWLGALITNPTVNGYKETPVRAPIERAAEMVPTERMGISVVMRGHDLMGVFLDEVRSAWSAAADLSAETNVVWKDRAFHTVISVAPPMYRELWTAGKCMYKLEPVVADGGRLIILAPHIAEISPKHGRWIEEIGYHTRDFFLTDPDRFRHVPRAVLAHSTHVKGIGTYGGGVERPRIEVVLSTGLSKSACRAINLGYQAPGTVDVDALADRESEGILVVPNAGEMLFRLADGSVPDIDSL